MLPARESSKLPWACPCAMSFSIMLVAFARPSAQTFAPSGPSSGYLPASLIDVRLDFKRSLSRLDARLRSHRRLR